MTKHPHRLPTEEEIRQLAHQLWHERGCPQGSPEVDWLAARYQLEANLALRQAHSQEPDEAPRSTRGSWLTTSDRKDAKWTISSV